MSDDRNGQVVTFYSYKGGTGRTMALANVAWILAANGYRVLVVDWDLESPGLHRFFNPFISADTLDSTGGVIDLIRRFEWATTQEPHADRDPEWYKDFARVQRYAFSLKWDFPDDATLDFLSAGLQNTDYLATLNAMDWDNFYQRLGGGEFLDALRDDMRGRYDFTLIDSRTGLSDVAAICTTHLPDILVDCFTFSEQGVQGAARIAAEVGQRHGDRIRVLPVPMRVDLAEKERAVSARRYAMQRFKGLPAGLSDEQRNDYWNRVQVPYLPFYAYEEVLATFGEASGAPLLSAYEQLTSHITAGRVTSLPVMDENLRERITARFMRRLAVAEDEVTLEYTPQDLVWAEWIEQVLTAAGVRVNHPRPAAVANGEQPIESATSSARKLVVISHANATAEANTVPREPGGQNSRLAVYVADVRQASVPSATSVSLVGHDVNATAAAHRLLKLCGRTGVDVDAIVDNLGLRFPGEDSVVFSVPARNLLFTGREEDLLELRTALRAQRTTVVLPGAVPVALQGMGGIGKTQLAMEYAYRFRNAYDVVWWLDADPPTFLDVSLADLGGRLGFQPQPSVPETTRAVLRALERGEKYQRWLLIYDNAEGIEGVQPFLPSGTLATGHVLITSRNPDWSNHAETLPVEVFKRSESRAHLRSRVPSVKLDEANKIAEVLGDLPIAIAAAGAWLAETGMPVHEYLRQVERDGVPDEAVKATFDLSLRRLEQQSPAAYRLLQLCSVLASEVALELIYSDEMAAALSSLDPQLAERAVLARLVQQINRLALLKLDLERGRDAETGKRVLARSGVGAIGGQLVVHRQLQAVVRDRMTPDEQNEARHQVHLVLAASRPRGDVDDPDTWRRFRMLWPHLDVSEAVNCPTESVRQLVIDRLRYIWLNGGLDQARLLGNNIDETWSHRLNTDANAKEQPVLRRQLLHMRFNLANVLRDRSQFLDARKLDESVLEQQRTLLGSDHPHTLMTAGGLSADLRALGEYKDALAQDLLTYQAWSESYGPDHPRTLTALNNLASSFRLVGDYRSALERDTLAHDRRRHVLGEDHPNTWSSAANLGRDMREAGEYEQSIGWLQTVFEGYSDILGPQSRGALNTQANLAVSLRSVGRAADAADLLDGAYGRLLDSLGPQSPDTLSCRLTRSLNLLSLNQVDRAARELEAVRLAYDSGLGATHPHTLVCENNKAAIARAQGDRPLALDLGRRAAEQLGIVLGAAHPYALAASMNVAIIMAELGDVETALGIAHAVAVEIALVLGQDHPDALRARGNVALMVETLGRGEPKFDRAAIAGQLASRIGETHPAVQALRNREYLHRVLDPHPF